MNVENKESETRAMRTDGNIRQPVHLIGTGCLFFPTQAVGKQSSPLPPKGPKKYFAARFRQNCQRISNVPLEESRCTWMTRKIYRI